ncbi:MAG: hypothetical protein FNP40_15840 [Dehalobacter sp. 4CP]|uniref:hypothetical protein n=1 Tax=Dehalobacter sp. CP TaxID=2594474 RepID=UPI0013C54FF5|nr:hypothetical protein [Dehalobacter sp. 4CP]
MSIAAIISLCLTAGLFIISSLFKIAGKLRLGIPLIYLLIAVVSTFFTRWTTEHEQLVLMGLYIVIGLTALSWIISLIKTIRRRRDEKYLEDDVAWQIQRAREMGIPLDKIQFNGQGDLLDPRTGEPVVYGQATSFKDI